MRNDFLLFVLILISSVTNAQQHVFKVKADTASITNAELILENKTKDTLGFLYNKGNGRTEFRRALTSLGNMKYLIGQDTLKLSGNYAALSHTHSQSEVINLISDLAGKEPSIAAGTIFQYMRGDKNWQTLSTSVVPEVSNLYYTDTRARAAITLTTNGTSGAATYTSSTGVLNIPRYLSASSSGWSLTGNSINPATDFIGTTSNNSFRIKTNNVERMKFDSSGNIIVTIPSGSNVTFFSSGTPLHGFDSYGGYNALGNITANGKIISVGNGDFRTTLTIGAFSSYPGGIDGSASFEVISPTKGVLLPKMSAPTAINKTLKTITVTNGGSGYSSAPTVLINGGSISSSKLTAVVSGGVVTSVTINKNSATDILTTPPTITFTGGGGSGAAATTTIDYTEGVLIYNTTLHGFEYYNGTSWQLMSSTTQ